jgi:vancomycin resistance protein YoaR
LAATHPEEIHLEPVSERALARTLRALLVVVAMTVMVVVAVLLAWITYERISDGRAYQGVTAAGVPLGGMTADEATAALTPAMAELYAGTAEVSVAGSPLRPTFAELGRAPDVASTVAAVMAVGRGLTLEEQIVERLGALTGGRAVATQMTFDRQALGAWISAVAVAERRSPTPASLRLDGRRFVVTPDSLGVGIDQGALAAQLAPSLAEPTTTTATATATTVPLESDNNDTDVLVTKVAVADMARPVTVALGKKTWTFSAPRVRSWLRLVEGPHGAVPALDAAAVQQAVTKTLAKQVKRKPLQTRFLVTKSGKRFGFVAGRPGRQLDSAAMTQRVSARVLGRRMGLPEGGALAVAMKGVELKMSAAEASEIVPQMTRLAGWTTYFPQGERNGNGINIHLPARILNGTVIRPGEIFDFVRAVGPFSWARGYRMGGIIQGSRTLPTGAVAGGICSASTTMFNAAVRAGLDILTRDNHSYYITRYPLGLDATVSTKAGTIVQNMRFRNDTPHPIFVSAAYGFGWVRFELYAIEQTRQVSFSRPQVSNRIKATDRVVRTSRLRAGQSERVEYPADGMDVAVTRTVRSASGRVLHTDTFRSHYVRWNGILEVGTR